MDGSALSKDEKKQVTPAAAGIRNAAATPLKPRTRPHNVGSNKHNGVIGMEYKNIILEKDGEIVTMTINRPQILNALDDDTYNEIGAAVDEIRQDKALRVLIITGAGKAFVAGADINLLRVLTGPQARANSDRCNRIMRKIETMEIPAIAAINGHAFGGGCELALACDIRLAAEEAQLGLPEVSLGVMPGCGGNLRLPALVGAGRAREMIYTAARISAEEAYRIGLVNHVYPADQLMEETRKLAQRIIKNAPRSVELSKYVIDQGLQMNIDTALRVEADAFGMCCATEDKNEGTEAFLQKRKPVYKGK